MKDEMMKGSRIGTGFHPSSFRLHPFLAMRLRVIWTGKTRDAHLKALIDDYLKRLSHFAKCEVSEFRESSGAQMKMGIDKDSQRISDGLHEGAVNVLLDPQGASGPRSNWQTS